MFTYARGLSSRSIKYREILNLMAPKRKQNRRGVQSQRKQMMTSMEAASEGESSATTSGDSGDYDWNVRSRLIRLHGDDPPTEKRGIQKIIKDNGLNHGDVVSFSEYRHTQSYIITRKSNTNQFSWIENPDESGSGYLTIPRHVLHYVTDALDKYHEFIHDGLASCINLHISPEDRLIVEKFGEGVDKVWDFDLCYVDGILDTFCVQGPGQHFQEFDFDKVTLKDMLEYFGGQDEEQANFYVRVYLSAETFVAYKEKYGSKKKLAWLTARPTLPKTWTVESGQRHGGSAHSSWVWKLKGPKTQEDAARSALTNFLDGFEFEFADNGNLPIK